MSGAKVVTFWLITNSFAELLLFLIKGNEK